MFDEPFSSKHDLIERLEDAHILKSEKLKKALTVVDRKDFMDKDHVVEAYEDYPVPIGHGQTISQPAVVVHMLSLLDPQEGDRILDVGCGSGWTTILLGYLAGTAGEVVAIDIRKDFVELTRNRATAYSHTSPHIGVFHASEENLIYTEPFDKILVNASFESEDAIPHILKSSLKENGRMLAPVGNDLVIFSTREGVFTEEKRFPGTVSFVPFVTDMSDHA